MLIRFFKAFFAALFSIITNQQTIIAGQNQILAEQAKLVGCGRFLTAPLYSSPSIPLFI